MIQKEKRKFAVQVGIEIALLAVYIWIVEVWAPGWFRPIFLWGFCVGFPIACIARDQARTPQSFPEFSLDWRAFLRCLRLLVWFTAITTAVLILIALVFGNLNYDNKFLMRFSEYVFWAFLQQIGLQTFFTWRVGNVIDNPYRAAGVVAVVFSMIHFPNPVLMIFTLIGGFFWSLSYLKAPNLYALAVSHGWLAVVALHSIPRSWLHQLRIGPTFWSF
ncbi:MAG: hypothetical protein A2901_02125 [Elusimicrobia bacterium RIFCSPLOWO2_01_FULL_54_10]|nr:MAG: hypothetical protein A2901_02125 [Elusimicrobia bacterium RIFCSPLOWO2_01_FULL_54_10]